MRHWWATGGKTDVALALFIIGLINLLYMLIE
jgi:hypothetical protein